MTDPVVPRELFDSEITSVRREISSLKELLKTQIAAVEDSAKLALDAADKATLKADATFEKRMDTTNEWRGALDDALKGRASVEQVEAIKERVESTEKKLDAMLNKVVGFGVLITFIVGVIAIAGRWT